MISSKCNPWAAPGTEEPGPAWLSHTAIVLEAHSGCPWAKPCLGQNRKRQHFPCHESAGDLGPRDVGPAAPSSSCSRNQQRLHLIWLHCCKCHRWVRNVSVKSSKDLCPSLLLRVTLPLKVFLFVELREEKGKLSHLFKGMVAFIELSGAATRCPSFLMTAPE